MNIDMASYNGYNFAFRKDTTDQYIINEVLVRGIYNHNYFLPPSPVVVDIGGHIGLFTIFCKLKYKDAKIMTYEPHRESFDLLSMNTKPMSGVTIHNKGVSGVKKTAILLGDEPNKTSLIYGDGNGQEIDCVSLNDVFVDNKIEHIDLLKVDCEGSEYEILMGFKGSGNFEKISNIVLEYHEFEGRSETFKMLRDFLELNGYRLVFCNIEGINQDAIHGMAFFVRQSILDKVVEPLRSKFIDEYFDEIYVINMDRRPDRLFAVQQQLRNANIKKFKRIPGVEFKLVGGDLSNHAIMNSESSIRNFHIGNSSTEQKVKYINACMGVRLAQKNCVLHARAMGYKRILILEDDVLVRQDANIQFKKAIEQLGTWDMLYLGGDYRDNNVTFQASSYALTNNVYDYYIDNIESSGLEADYFLIEWIRPKFETKRIEPMLMAQHKKDTDIQIT